MLIKLAALGGLGYLGYRYYEKNVRPQQREAYATGTASAPRKDTWDTIENDPAVTTTNGTTTATTN